MPTLSTIDATARPRLRPSLSPSPTGHRSRRSTGRWGRRTSVRVALAGLAATAFWLAGALPASAHVRVQADDPAAGGSSQLTFTVPTESDDAGTTEVSLTLPQDHPFLYVSARPVSGWDVSVNEATLPRPVDVGGTTLTKAVRTVTWTATEGQQVGPGEYQQFAIMVGPLPAAGTSLEIPATQTYSDGKVVKWDQSTPASGEEPEYPAPTLVVGAATDDGHGSGSHGADDASSAPTSSSTGSTGSGQGGGTGSGQGETSATAEATGSSAGLALGVAGAGLGLVGAVLGGIALARTRSRG